MIVYGVQLTAKPGKGVELGGSLPDLRTVLTDTTGEQWFAWAAVGADQTYGTFMLSTRASGIEQLLGMRQAVGQNDDFVQLSGQLGEAMATTATEHVNEVIHVAGDAADGPLPVTQVTTAAMAPGHWRAGGAFAVQVADHAAQVSGVSVMVATSALGPMGSVSWFAGVADAAAVDQTNAALGADERYVEMVDESGPHFIAGSAMRAVLAQMP